MGNEIESRPGNLPDDFCFKPSFIREKEETKPTYKPDYKNFGELKEKSRALMNIHDPKIMLDICLTLRKVETYISRTHSKDAIAIIELAEKFIGTCCSFTVVSDENIAQTILDTIPCDFRNKTHLEKLLDNHVDKKENDLEKYNYLFSICDGLASPVIDKNKVIKKDKPKTTDSLYGVPV